MEDIKSYIFSILEQPFLLTFCFILGLLLIVKGCFDFYSGYKLGQLDTETKDFITNGKYSRLEEKNDKD